VSHFGDAASWYWPKRPCRYAMLGPRDVGPRESKTSPSGAYQHATGRYRCRSSSAEPEEAREWAGPDPAQVKMYSTVANGKG
jgi:hypothetical protein